jgi:amino acid transporter
MSHHKLSFWTAVLVNLNVMFGAGIFINTVTLTKLTGFFGFLSYVLVAILLIPLILATAALLRKYPEGGFYAYAAKSIHPFAGFISSWAYFTGKLASAALLVHVFCSLISSIFELPTTYILVFDSLILSFFAWLNILHMKTGRAIMYTFMMFKIVPILFAILCCFYLYSSWSIPAQTLLWSGIPTAIPLVLFAFTGFEVCCSLSDSLENAEKNGPRVVFLTYGLVVGITILYQLLFFLSVGPSLMTEGSYLDVFPTIFKALHMNAPWALQHLVAVLHVALACASLGGCYGILFSNHWNLYALAKHNHTFFPSWLTRLNAHAIPTACILIEACLCVFYLYFTQGAVVVLQQLSVLGSIITYTLSVLGLLSVACQQSLSYEKIVSWLALGSCAFFIMASIRNFYMNGLSALYLFLGLLVFGITMFFITTKKHQKAA